MTRTIMLIIEVLIALIAVGLIIYKVSQTLGA